MSFTDQMRAAHADIAFEVSRVAEVARAIKAELGIYSKVAECSEAESKSRGEPIPSGFFPVEMAHLRDTYSRLEDAMRDLADIFDAIKVDAPSKEATQAR